jgi:hypothetical protein
MLGAGCARHPKTGDVVRDRNVPLPAWRWLRPQPKWHGPRVFAMDLAKDPVRQGSLARSTTKKFARRADIFSDSSPALALRFARHHKHRGVVRDRKDRKDRNVSRWSPIIPMSDPLSASGFSRIIKFARRANIFSVSSTKRERVDPEERHSSTGRAAEPVAPCYLHGARPTLSPSHP